ncbi:TPA: hypothetical protein P2Q98_004522 [Aeromonas veronii]|nr:hypothetical protein [Aeromonas hydrophila]ELV7510821.1 hypothetical protein [Aeromonas veronii]HDO1331727.1 hypothetical protein [Aeromonas veronii]HDO1336251.1 hypothetical protein [Aeromonas veronii]HDO1340772.1 hypothetical protein [Aeromonas veronii]HDO1345299.1 hypothetical protein [Aeromonas veronii]
MTIPQAVALGLSGNELSKEITGSDEVSVGRTVVAAGSGAVMGAAAAGAITVGAAAVGIAAAPVTVPLAVASAVVAGIASLFDD